MLAEVFILFPTSSHEHVSQLSPFLFFCTRLPAPMYPFISSCPHSKVALFLPFFLILFFIATYLIIHGVPSLIVFHSETNVWTLTKLIHPRTLRRLSAAPKTDNNGGFLSAAECECLCACIMKSASRLERMIEMVLDVPRLQPVVI